jgi:hypothetical protein
VTRRIACIGAFSAVLALNSIEARADTCGVPEGGNAALAAMDARKRLAFVHVTLDDQARYVERWKWAWVGIGSASLAVSAGLTIGWAVSNDPHVRDANFIDNLVATGFSVFTPITTIVFAPRIDAPIADELFAATGGGEAGTCLVLARMEELLAKGAAEEAFATGWLAHTASILGVGVMVAIMAVQGALETDPLARDAHLQNALINGVAGVFYAEAQLLTAPTGAKTGWAHYLKGDLPHKSASAVTVRPVPMGAGIGLRVTFD